MQTNCIIVFTPSVVVTAIAAPIIPYLGIISKLRTILIVKLIIAMTVIMLNLSLEFIIAVSWAVSAIHTIEKLRILKTVTALLYSGEIIASSGTAGKVNGRAPKRAESNNVFESLEELVLTDLQQP
jgi:hypothetical protein